MSQRRYAAIPPQVNLPAMERAVLALWHEQDTFARSLARGSARHGAPGRPHRPDRPC